MVRARPKIAVLGYEEADGFLPFFRERVGEHLELVGVDPGELSIRDGEVLHGSQSLDEIDLAVIRDLGGEQERACLSALERRVPFLNPVAAVAVSVDKVLQSERFKAAGVACPEFAVVRHPDDVVQVEQLFGPPYVLKDPRLECGTGVFLLPSVAELEDMLFYLWEAAPARYPLLVQPFVACAGGQQRDERVVVLDGEVLAVIGRVCGERFKCNVFQGGSLVTSSISSAEADLARAALEAVGLCFGGVDLIRDAGGQSFVLEVNASPGGLDIIYEDFGHDVLARVAHHIEGRLAR
jgi:RimK family alpha-L-glutamate ligase